MPRRCRIDPSGPRYQNPADFGISLLGLAFTPLVASSSPRRSIRPAKARSKISSGSQMPRRNGDVGGVVGAHLRSFGTSRLFGNTASASLHRPAPGVWLFRIPKGFNHSAQGWPPRPTLGLTQNDVLPRTGLNQSLGRNSTPFAFGVGNVVTVPRVARASQSWAE